MTKRTLKIYILLFIFLIICTSSFAEYAINREGNEYIVKIPEGDRINDVGEIRVSTVPIEKSGNTFVFGHKETDDKGNTQYVSYHFDKIENNIIVLKRINQDGKRNFNWLIDTPKEHKDYAKLEVEGILIKLTIIDENTLKAEVIDQDLSRQYKASKEVVP